jgi:hypothetical protein
MLVVGEVVKVYIRLSAILMVSAVGEIVNVIEGPPSLQEKDPLSGASYGRLLLLAAIWELSPCSVGSGSNLRSFAWSCY